MFTINHLVSSAVPGQVPRLDRDIDRTHVVPPASARPAAETKKAADALIRANLSSPNEALFRGAVLADLITKGVDPKTRREIMTRALALYRSARPSASTDIPTRTLRPSRLPNVEPAPAPESEPLERAVRRKRESAPRGGKYHRRVPAGRGKWKYVYNEAAYRRMPGAHVDGESASRDYVHGKVGRILDKAGADGAPVADFHRLVARHGAKTVADAIRAHGGQHAKGRIRRAAQAPIAKSERSAFHVVLRKADDGAGSAGTAENRPASSSGGSFGTTGGGMPSPKKLPPGTRRMWHNRIVERGLDDKWHVVGHVAGLEDPAKTKLQPLAPHEIDPGHLKGLIAKLKELIAHEKEKASTIQAPIPGAKPAPEAGSSAPKAKTQVPSAKRAHDRETKNRKLAADTGVASSKG